MFMDHGTHYWTLDLDKLASLGCDGEWETPPFYPLESDRMALCFNNAGVFRLALLHRQQLTSTARPSYDHNLKHCGLRHAICEVWSTDRTECYHSHRFVVFGSYPELRVDWEVPRLLKMAQSCNKDERICIVAFQVDSRNLENQLMYRRGITARLAEAGVKVARLVRQECQEKHLVTLNEMFSKTQQSLQVIYSTAHPFDVRFEFGSATDLWENSAFLASQSPYFADLFAAGFLESVTKPLDPERCSVPARTVHVTTGRLEEYRAVFVWLRTGFIRFDDSPEGSHDQAAVQDTNLIQASSIYSLAQFLQIPELSALALKFCLEHLTPAKVAEELFREWSYLHKEVRQELIQYAVRNWSEVKTSKSITEACKTIGSDDLPFETQSVLLELTAKVATGM
ncbi:BZ3500_MvSof-1268-A1-R1_Chr3-1g06124 [Microbotryum saponariae]|uniref:BZ3500_MvSof-1268-A1-R1_Chr3-1g06124 protein n=1 Tax=Microbotryum saponariae TaxID=289078 RepID=A0A2X0LTB2_9BASI|nr:BZ3500_MvSof-1268-A1-R1_Chr3-1g06124 [Microbotryum saponariae]SDA03987.1 BZ3501_MvSof-1269-A2-R1_Chr3-2g05809 [Microbotryum saponariae]